ncbi:MAG: zf-HC2 domain-containing protein [Thermodesulfobacteriota bacterium]
MDCKDIEILLSNAAAGELRDGELRDGELSEDERLKLDAHLSGCPRCREEFSRLKETLGKLKTLPTPEPPDGFWPELQSAILKELRAEDGNPTHPVRKRPRAVPRWMQGFAIAATVAALVVAGALFTGKNGVRPDLPIVTIEELLYAEPSLPALFQDEGLEILDEIDYADAGLSDPYYGLFELDTDELESIYEGIEDITYGSYLTA